MTNLSVNVNKVATLRNARGGPLPNLPQVAADVERFGADGITLHPRPDERHITRQDVITLSAQNKTEYNVEGYPSEDFLQLVEQVQPTQVTLVPDSPDVLTSNAGWKAIEHEDLLAVVIERLRSRGMRVSLFMECDPKQLEKVAELGADRVELYTEDYASNYNNKEEAIKPYRDASVLVSELNLGLNAGHDLNLHNLKYFKENTVDLLEVSIGHALWSDALYYGMEETIKRYKRELA